MNVDVLFTPRTLDDESLRGKTVVVVDVLRACSTIVTALYHGARAVVPVADMAEAGRIAAALDAETSLLGGERGGRTIDGYRVGNSPLEYTPEVAAGKTVVLNTTNGTSALAKARKAERLVAGCFLNADRVVGFLREAQAADDGGEPQVVIVCAGQDGRLALEDVLCAGMLLHRLWGDAVPEWITDGAHIALTQYRHDEHRLARALFACRHTQRLIALGHGDDVAYCARLDALPVLPRFADSRLSLDHADRALAAEALAARQAASEDAPETTAKAVKAGA